MTRLSHNELQGRMSGLSLIGGGFQGQQPSGLDRVASGFASLLGGPDTSAPKTTGPNNIASLITPQPNGP
jgi:hypothetical protein